MPLVNWLRFSALPGHLSFILTECAAWRLVAVQCAAESLVSIEALLLRVCECSVGGSLCPPQTGGAAGALRSERGGVLSLPTMQRGTRLSLSAPCATAETRQR